MKSWWVWVAAAVVTASPAIAREHRRDGSDGHGSSRSGKSHDSGGSRDRGSHSGGTRSSSRQADRSHDSRRSEHATRRDDDRGRTDSYASAERRRPSSYDSRWRGSTSRRYTPSYSHGYRRRTPYISLSLFPRYRPTYYYNYRYYRPHYVYGGSYYDYDYYSYDRDGAVRVLVEPSETAVYVDGYYVGVADDFDGVFQRLYLQPGRHEIALKLAGFRTWRADVYSSAGHTIKLRHDMLEGHGPEDIERFSANPDDEETDARDTATLHLDVEPRDAAVYIDGEPFNLAQKDIPVPEGRHRIEIVRPGYRSIQRNFEARPGKTIDMRVDLLETDSRATDAGRP
jgi:hypothetical protein